MPQPDWSTIDLQRLMNVDEKATNKTKDEIAEKTKRIFQYDNSLEEEVLEKIGKLFDLAKSYQRDKSLELDDKIIALRNDIRNKFGIELSIQSVKNLILRSEWFRFQRDIKGVIHYIMTKRGVITDKNRYITLKRDNKIDLWTKDNESESEVEFSEKTLIKYPSEVQPFLYKYLTEKFYTQKSEWDRETIRTTVEVCQLFIVPNITYLEKETEKARRRALENIHTVTKTYQKDSIIIAQGQVVTYEKQIALDRLNALKRTYNFLNLICTAIFVCAFALFISIYIRRFEVEISFTAPNVIMVSLPIILALLTHAGIMVLWLAILMA